MTVEIAVLNQQGAALAADSAVTVSGEHGTKIYTSANKIFALSKHWPIGVMVYGSASLSGLPWETIIKVYREELRDRYFEELPGQAEHFLTWLGNAQMLKGGAEAHFVQIQAGAFLNAVKRSITEEVGKMIDQKAGEDELTLSEVRKITRETITGIGQNYVSKAPRREFPQDFEDELLQKHGDVIDETITQISEELPLTGSLRKRLRRLATAPFVRQLVQDDSGIVIAGFGCRDYFPRLRSYHVDGVVLGQVIYSDYTSMDIGPGHDGASVAAFAQRDFIQMFMEGVHPLYEQFIESYLTQTVDRLTQAVTEAGADEAVQTALKQVRDDFHEECAGELEAKRFEAYVAPVLEAVASLPKDELAALAESLVNLTVLKKHVSHEDETVGGPIDVAVISKGDGLIWVKRKHYFDPALNHHFFTNYYRRVPDVS
jgi:hypothetical protein